MKKFLFLFLTVFPQSKPNWGFFGHKQINHLAVFTLEPELLKFYKANIDFITEEAVTPDKRRYAVKEEAPRHFIDLDAYQNLSPCSWHDAVAKYTEDSLQKHGILPWHVLLLKLKLTDAFRNKDYESILRLSSDLGHYLADANVPLHTTRNYNGQLTGQEGIHGFWESRLPELYFNNYDLLTGRATHIKNTQKVIWETIYRSNQAVDSVLKYEKELSRSFPADKKYTYEQRGNTLVKSYSSEYAAKYHKMLSGQVERQFKNSILLVGNFWHTCWVDAGRPSLSAERIEYKNTPQKHNIISEEGCHGH